MKYERLEAGNYYHVYNRGNNKENIFIEDKNYVFFLNQLHNYTYSVCNIISYCLLKNHFHILIKTKENIDDKIISQKFSNFFNSYSKSINKSYNRSGSLFQDRFLRIKVDNESYLKILIRYIHLNPLHHGFVDDFKKYKYSSYNSILSEKPTHLLRNEVLDLFEDKENFIFYHKTKQIEINNGLFLE